MTGFIIVLVAILSVVGSVVWVRPSKRDVKLADWRQEARKAGLHVKLEGLAAEPRESGIRDDVTGASYYLYNPQPDKKDDLSWAVVNVQGWLQDNLPADWSWYHREVAINSVDLNRLMSSLSLPIKAIERTPKYSRIIWDESGLEFDAEQLKDLLTKIHTIT